MSNVLGIDIGGTGVKAAVVDTANGKLASERLKYATPKPSYPHAVMEVVKKLVEEHKWEGKPMGCGFPGIVKKNVIYSTANVDNTWLNLDLEKLFEETIGQKASFINDADAAGLAEMRHGKGRGIDGTVLLLTLGTGIGSALFIDQKLVPNTEFGHLEHKDSVWEHYAGNKARESKDLSWKEWGGELDAYLKHIDFLVNPDLIIIGGGVSKKFHKYREYLFLKDKVVPADHLNMAGIIGAAMSAI